MFNAIEPFATGHLPVGDGNEIYWEASGNPKGKPALYLHGGPGGRISAGYRRHFDPERFLIISFEQRGCGRSKPRVTDLALAYALAHPEKVSALVLAAVSTTTSSEVKWVTEDMGRIFPREWDQFVAAVKPASDERVIDAYYRQITSKDLKVRDDTSRAWCAWEDVHVSLDPQYKPNPQFQNLDFSLPFSMLTIHYWKHSAFLNESDILENIHRISHIPCVLIHGRLDVSSPLETAWKLHKDWPGSILKVVEGEGHGGKSMFAEITNAVQEISS